MPAASYATRLYLHGLGPCGDGTGRLWRGCYAFALSGYFRHFAEVGGDVCTACLRAVPLFPYRANVSVGCSDRLLGLRHGHGRVHGNDFHDLRSEEHTSELQSLMRNSYAV